MTETTDQTMLDENLTFGAIRNDPAPEYTTDIKMTDYDLSQRFRWAKDEIPAKPTLTMNEIERLFRMPKRGAQRLVQKYLMPLGAVERVGRKYIVQTWGVRKLVGATDG